MKIIYFSLLIFIFSCTQEKKGDAAEETTTHNEVSQQAEPFAVVELFSSEGCSDCPPAEELLNKITKEAMEYKTYVYPLAFHVDYRNKLGWKDSFSDSSFSNQQRVFDSRTLKNSKRNFSNEIEIGGNRQEPFPPLHLCRMQTL